jgi:hypothetical protein
MHRLLAGPAPARPGPATLDCQVDTKAEPNPPLPPPDRRPWGSTKACSIF